MNKYRLFLSLCCLPLFAIAQKKQEMPVALKVIVNGEKKQGLMLYSKEVPLQIRDFKSRPDETSPGVGATYSGILMEMEGQSENGVLVTTVALSIYFDPGKSWMKKEGKNERVLKHEQAHFDLTAIKACALANAIAAEPFRSGNLKQRLRELHRVHTRDLQQLQYQYDKETKHGTDAEQQAIWASRIAGELTAVTCL